MITSLFGEVRDARYPETGPVMLAMAVDAEEAFDWDSPISGTPFSTQCNRYIRDLHEILLAYRLCPTYMLTYPVMEDREVVAMLRRLRDQGSCELGVQLHPWVTPPFSSTEHSLRASFAGNLERSMEAAKLARLVEKYRQTFGDLPKAYRAGRYGLGPNSAELLEEHHFEIDTSVAPRTSFASAGGPDYRRYDFRPFWFGRDRRVLELPLCRSVVGWGGRLAPAAYAMISGPGAKASLATGVLTRLRFAERITLSPEGNDASAILRLARRLSQSGRRVLVLSFHSSSLIAGGNPYVQSQRDLHLFLDRLSASLDAFARAGMSFRSLTELRQMAV